MAHRLKYFAIIFTLATYACTSSKSEQVTLTYGQPAKGQIYNDKATIPVQIAVEGTADSVILYCNRRRQPPSKNNTWEIPVPALVMGENLLVANAYKNGKSVAKKYIQFKVQPQTPSQKWSYKLIRKIHHATTSFTQGLFYHKGKLYESTGERGHSKLMTINPKDGKVLKSVKLTSHYFGEGATILNDKVYQITWTSGIGFIYDAETLKETSTFNYQKDSSQGWGLTTYKSQLVMSNGSHQLLFFDAKTMQLEDFIEVYSSNGKENMLNELEYAQGYIYANIWFKNHIAIIAPETGKVIAYIDCQELATAEQKLGINPAEDVFNGIAYNADTDTFYITGKRWHYIYEVQIIAEK